MRGRAFDALIVVLCAILVVGGHVLVWANIRGLTTGNELFSVWALPVYVGFVPAAYVLFVWWTSRRGGRRFSDAYRPALMGAGIFLAGIVLEFVWRSVGGTLGDGPESVISPARILLFAGALLLVSGPALSTSRRLSAAARSTVGPDSFLLASSIGFGFAMITLLTGFVHPVVVGAAAGGEVVGEQTATDLYFVPADGSGSRRLTTTRDAFEAHPDVSPDGTRIAFARGVTDDFRLFTMALTGGDERRLRTFEAHEDGALWRPDGQALSLWNAVESVVGGPATPGPAPAPGASSEPAPVDVSGLGTWLVNPDGTNADLLTAAGIGAESWAPDNTRFCGWSWGGSFDVVTFDVETGEITPVEAGPGEDWGCTWSRDGMTVCFHSDRTGNYEIECSNPDGTARRQITNDPAIDQLPRFSADGSRLAFASTRDGEWEIYVAAADGSNPTNLSNDPALDDGFYGIAWVPDGSGIVSASSGRAYASPAPSETVPLGVASIALQSLILTAVLLVAFRLSPGVFGIATLACLIDSVLVAMVGQTPLPALSILLAGVAADLIAWRRPRLGGLSLEIVAASVGALVFAGSYLLIVAVTTGLSWSLDLILGSILLSALLAGVAALSMTRATTRETREQPAESGLV
jgi:TolB protein